MSVNSSFIEMLANLSKSDELKDEFESQRALKRIAMRQISKLFGHIPPIRPVIREIRNDLAGPNEYERNAIEDGRKLDSIRSFRERSGFSLLNSKKTVESWYKTKMDANGFTLFDHWIV